MHRIYDSFARSPAALIFLWIAFILPRALMILLEITPTSDADFYFGRALEMAAGKGYNEVNGEPTAFWPPGWPMALSLAFRVTGTAIPPIYTVGLLNLLFGVITAWLTLDLGRRLFHSEAAGRTALLLLAIYPNNIAYYPLALTEVFYTMLLLAICWLLIARHSWLTVIAAGLLLGVATLVKAQTLVVVPLILGIEVFRSRYFWKAIPAATAKFVFLIAVAALVVAPWSMRNQREMGQFILVSTNGGLTLLTGNNDTTTGGYAPDDPLAKSVMDNKALSEMERDAEAARLGREWIMANPGRFVQLMPFKVAQLWLPDGEGQWGIEGGYANFEQHAAVARVLRWGNQIYYCLLLVGFAIAAIVMVRYRRRQEEPLIDWWLLPYGIAAYPTMIAMVFSGQSRFHYPVMPFVVMACGWLIAYAFQQSAARTKNRKLRNIGTVGAA